MKRTDPPYRDRRPSDGVMTSISLITFSVVFSSYMIFAPDRHVSGPVDHVTPMIDLDEPEARSELILASEGAKPCVAPRPVLVRAEWMEERCPGFADVHRILSLGVMSKEDTKKIEQVKTCIQTQNEFIQRQGDTDATPDHP